MSEQSTHAETPAERAEGTEEEYDNPGIEGQILYPDPRIDAERAAAFAGGKVDTLYPEDEGKSYEQITQEKATGNVMTAEEWDEQRNTGATGDETGLETEPTENPDYDPNDPEAR